MTTSLLPTAAQAPLGVPAMMDIEASGFGRNSYPIEVGFVLSDGRTYCTLIRPAPHWTSWDPGAEKVHRISLSTLVQDGHDVFYVANQLNERLRGLTVYCDGWAHDYVWLHVLFEAAGLTPAFKLDNLRVLLTEEEAASWGVVKRQVTDDMNLQRHRASSDAKILQRTLMWLRDPFAERTPELIVEMTDDPLCSID